LAAKMPSCTQLEYIDLKKEKQNGAESEAMPDLKDLDGQQ